MADARYMKKAVSDLDAIETLPLESLLFDGEDNIDATNELGQTALIKACDEGCLQKVVSLVRHGANLNCKDHDGMTPMRCACKHGFTTLVELLVESGVQISRSAMDDAIQYDHSSLAKYLTNCQEMASMTPLMRACANGVEDIVRALIFNPDKIDDPHHEIGTTPLMYACENNHPTIANMLLNQNANVNKMDSKGTTALLYACENDMTDVIDVMLRSNLQRGIAFHALMTCKNTSSSSLLPVFIYFATGSITQLQTQDVTKRPERHSVDKEKWEYTCFVFNCLFDNDGNNSDTTALDYSTDPVFWVILEHIDRYKEAVEALLSSLDYIDGFYVNYALARAIDVGKLGGLKILFKHGVDFTVSLPYRSNDFGYTPLTYALHRNQTNIVKWLLAELNPNTVADALDWLCQNGSKDEVSLLLKLGIDSSIINGTSLNCDTSAPPLIQASRHHHGDIVQLLLDYGADVNRQDKKGNTALSMQFIPYEFQYEIVDILLNNGADLDIVDNRNRSVFTVFLEISQLTLGGKHYDITLYEKTIKRFVESGQLLTPQNRLKPVHCRTVESCFLGGNYFVLHLLINHGVFEWSLLPERRSAWEKTLTKAITSGVSPPVGPHLKGGLRSSPLVVSFQKSDLKLTLLLLDKLYFLPEDYQELKSQCFSQANDPSKNSRIFQKMFRGDLNVSDKGQQIDQLETTLRQRVLDTPQRLVDICFLSVSRVISVNYAPCARKQMVERLPLPTLIKTQLMFK